MMLTLFDRLPRGHDFSIDTIVHIGAGVGEDLDAIRALEPRRLILVEGDPKSVETLRKETANLESVEVLERAVTPEPGAATWHRFSMPGLNGLLAPSGIYQVYPRLRLTEQLQVETVGIEACLESLLIEPEASNLLVLDTPGLEGRLLERLSESLTHGFEWILIRGCATGFFEDCEPAWRAVELLEKQCFRLYTEDSTSDPAWPVRLMVRDEALIENRSLKARLAELTTSLAEHSLMMQKLREEVAQLGRERDEQTRAAAEQQEVAAKLSEECEGLVRENAKLARLESDRDQLLVRTEELDVALKHAIEGRDGQTKLVAARDSQITKLTQERDEHVAATRAWQAQVEQVARERDIQIDLAADRQMQNEKLTEAWSRQSDELTACRRRASELEAAHDRLKERMTERDAELQRRLAIEQVLRNDLADARRTASLAVKLQTLREADLKDLQDRYRESRDMQNKQRDLLVRLSERLSVATTYFHQLANDEAPALPRDQDRIEVRQNSSMRPRRKRPAAADRKA